MHVSLWYQSHLKTHKNMESGNLLESLDLSIIGFLDTKLNKLGAAYIFVSKFCNETGLDHIALSFYTQY